MWQAWPRAVVLRANESLLCDENVPINAGFEVGDLSTEQKCLRYPARHTHHLNLPWGRSLPSSRQHQ